MSDPTLEELLWGAWPSLGDMDRTTMVQTRLTDLADAAARVGDLEAELDGWRDDAVEAQDALTAVRVELADLRAKLAETPR